MLGSFLWISHQKTKDICIDFRCNVAGSVTAVKMAKLQKQLGLLNTWAP